MRHLVIVSLISLTFSGSYASIVEDSIKTSNTLERRWYLPHYIPIQYAGNIGFLSTGIGYSSRKENYQLSLVYGYAPRSLAGVPVHTLTAKNIFSLHRFHLNKKETLIPYGALGLSFEIGGRSFFQQPSNMPPSYYDFPKSVHIVASGGLKFRAITSRYKNLRGFEFFAETTTIDAYIWYKVRSDEVKLRHILSAAAGVHLLLK